LITTSRFKSNNWGVSWRWCYATHLHNFKHLIIEVLIRRHLLENMRLWLLQLRMALVGIWICHVLLVFSFILLHMNHTMAVTISYDQGVLQLKWLDLVLDACSYKASSITGPILLWWVNSPKIEVNAIIQGSVRWDSLGFVSSIDSMCNSYH